jgi:hypothetical protein
MDHIQLRVDQYAVEQPPKPEPATLTAELRLAWPSTATEADVGSFLDTVCDHALAAYRLKATDQPNTSKVSK